MEGTNEDGVDRTVVVFDLQGPGSPVPTFGQEVYEAGELVRNLPTSNTVNWIHAGQEQENTFVFLYFPHIQKEKKTF